MPNPEHDQPRPAWRTYLAAYDRAIARFQADPTMGNLALLRIGEEMLTRELWKPGRFALGQLVTTPGAVEAMRRGLHIPPEFLLRHAHGDWGELDPEDKRVNNQALISGGRLLSSYRTRLDDKLWVITEWDRSVTTLLLPEEY